MNQRHWWHLPQTPLILHCPETRLSVETQVHRQLLSGFLVPKEDLINIYRRKLKLHGIKCPLPKKVTRKFLPGHLRKPSMRLVALHCTVVPLFPMVPLILSGGSRFSVEEMFVTKPRFAAKSMFDRVSVARPNSLPGRSMFQVVLNVEFTAQLTSTCVPRGSTTGSGCSRNTCSH